MKKTLITQVAVLAGLLFSGTVQAQETWDDPVQWIIDNGFSSIQFMERCASVGPDGSQITTAPLPVGNGRWLSCHTYAPIHYDVTEVQANDGTIYCVLGSLANTAAAGDDRLDIGIADYGTSGPAWLSASADEPLWISMVSTFGGAWAWPLWLTSNYATQQIVAAPGGGVTCSQVFGL